MSVHVPRLRFVPSTGPIVPSRRRDQYCPIRALYVPHLVTEQEHNLKFLSKQITKDALTYRYGNNTTNTKIRAGKAVPPFSALYKAKFWQEAAWDSIRRQVARSRDAIPTTQASPDGIVTIKVDIVGVDRTVALVKDWKVVEDTSMQFNAVVVLCNDKTAHEMDGLVDYMANMSTKNLTVIVVGRRTEVTTHVALLSGGASGKGRKVAMIPLNVDPGGQYEEWDSLFPYDKSTPEALRADR